MRCRWFFACLVVILAVNCSSVPLTKADAGMVKGTVTYVDLEGGFYGIVSEKETLYPVNLPLQFQQDGLEITFGYRLLKRHVSTVQWGTPIEITSIKEP